MASTREVGMSHERCPDCGSGFARDLKGTGVRRHLSALPKRDPAIGEIARDAYGNPVCCGGTSRSWGKGKRSYLPAPSSSVGPSVQPSKLHPFGLAILIGTLVGIASNNSYFGVFCGSCVFWFVVLLAEAREGDGITVDRRPPNKHRWFSNGLRPRRMHWGPRRLF
jgi:hypothetical protein